MAEEISFTVHDGQGEFNSWLHQRPFTINGSWSVAGSRLKIQETDSLTSEYSIVQVNEQQLLLRELYKGEQAIYYRMSYTP